MPDAVWGVLERLLGRLPRRGQRALNRLVALSLTARSIAGYTWRRRDPRRLGLAAWMVPATALGWLFGSELSGLVAFAARALLGLSRRGDADGAWAVPLSILDWTTYGLVVSAAQALVLARFVTGFSRRRWVAASAAGSVIAATLVVGWYDREIAPRIGATFAGGLLATGADRTLLWGLCLALPQWWILRPHVQRRAGPIWVLARTLGDTASAEARLAVAAVWTGIAGPQAGSLQPVGPLNVSPLVAAGAAFGAVTGLAVAAIARTDALAPPVPRDAPALRPGWRFLLLWVLATVIATALAVEVFTPLQFVLRGHRVVDGDIVPGSRGGFLGAVLLTFLSAWEQGLLIGTAQWLVLRLALRHTPTARRWIGRTALGQVAGDVLSYVIFGTGTVFTELGLVPAGFGVAFTLAGLAARGATIGLLQHRLLRTVVERSAIWIPAYAAAIVLSSFPGVTLTYGIGLAGVTLGYPPWVLATLSIGLLNGLVLGGVMTWLLRRPADRALSQDGWASTRGPESLQ